jgi:methylthioribose-1-phosphate isomerase
VLADKAEDFRTIWLSPDDESVVQIIDQRLLPHEYCIHDLRTWQDGVEAISDMYVRGAPLIGATAAWSLYLASLRADDTQAEIDTAADALLKSRPTAVNLRWAVERVLDRLRSASGAAEVTSLARREAENICDEDIEISRGIGDHGLLLIEAIAAK